MALSTSLCHAAAVELRLGRDAMRELGMAVGGGKRKRDDGGPPVVDADAVERVSRKRHASRPRPPAHYLYM